MTELYGVFGWPVAHSKSPAMHNAAFRALGRDALYVPFAVPPERLPQAIEAVRTLGVRGFNVTLPLKTDVMLLLDALEPAAQAIGAVNTVLRDGDRLIGTNTDAGGLTRSLVAAGVNLKGVQAVVLGAGGAARAALFGLAEAGATQIVVAARRLEAAQRLVDELSAACAPAELAACTLERGPLQTAFAHAGLLVQASSATLGDTAEGRAFVAALPLGALPPGAAVCDLVYKPRTTALLASAREHGLLAVDGLGMLLHQGALAFERWTGVTAPLDAMGKALVG